MPCSGFLEMLENRARAEGFNANILRDIEKLKKQLDKRIAQLRIMGNQYEASRKQQLLTHLNRVEQRMKELVELLEA